MKIIKIMAISIMVAAILFAAMPVGAETTRTPIHAVEYACAKTPGQEWVAGGVYHIRGEIHENVVVADGEIWGINTASIDLDYNLVTGQIVARGFADFVPLGADGGYTGTGFFRFFGAGNKPVIGVGSLQGYGGLQGQSIHLNMDGLPPDPAGESYCAGHGTYFDTTQWEGYIQSTDG